MSGPYTVLGYIRPHHEAYYRTLCGELFGGGRTTFISDFPGVGDLQTHERFYGHLRSPDAGRLPSDLPEDVADDMALRCRFLRGFAPDKQRRLLAAMVAAMDDALERVRPDFVMSLTVDCYVNDS